MMREKLLFIHTSPMMTKWQFATKYFGSINVFVFHTTPQRVLDVWFGNWHLENAPYSSVWLYHCDRAMRNKNKNAEITYALHSRAIEPVFSTEICMRIKPRWMRKLNSEIHKEICIFLEKYPRPLFFGLLLSSTVMTSVLSAEWNILYIAVWNSSCQTSMMIWNNVHDKFISLSIVVLLRCP